jgi:hypothetical protein
MKISILPGSGPEPRNVRIYLRTHGWLRESSSAAGPTVWMLPTDQGTYEVIAPSSRNARDFSARIAELLRTLSVAEDRPPEDILDDLFTLEYDIQYIHNEYGGPPGTAPLRDAVGVYGAVQSMMSAVAASLNEPLPVLPRRRSARAADVLQSVLAGPTTSGSYVISIWTPIPPRMTPEEDPVLFEIQDEPFPRRTTALLNTALRSARAAANMVYSGNANLSTFIDRAAEGVSANLCESLVSLSGDRRTPVDVHFAWALDRPMPASEEPIRFDTPNFDVLSDAARMMRTQLPEDDVTLRGNVVRLHRESTRLGAGEVTIAGVLSGDRAERLRKVWVSLSEADYQLAIQAHRTFAEVELLGSLIQRGGRTYLNLIGDFNILPDPETL